MKDVVWLCVVGRWQNRAYEELYGLDHHWSLVAGHWQNHNQDDYAAREKARLD